jgi:hypothetical protein
MVEGRFGGTSKTPRDVGTRISEAQTSLAVTVTREQGKRYSSIEDVIAKVNASPYGLAGSIWCSDVAQGTAVASRVETGLMWVNSHVPA